MELRFAGEETRNNDVLLLDTHTDTHNVSGYNIYITPNYKVLKTLIKMVAGRGFEPLTFGL